jgi:hypothetical protein
MGKGFCVGEIVDRYKLKIGVLVPYPEYLPPDSTKSIDTHPDRHGSLLIFVLNII